MGARGNTLRKPGSGRPETDLTSACRKIVEKAALVKGGSAAKVRSALTAKGYVYTLYLCSSVISFGVVFFLFSEL